MRVRMRSLNDRVRVHSTVRHVRLELNVVDEEGGSSNHVCYTTEVADLENTRVS